MSHKHWIAIAALSFGALLVSGARPLRADSPSGSFTIPFDGENSIVTLETLTTTPPQQVLGPAGADQVLVDLTRTLTLSTDAKGKVTGSGTVDFTVTQGAVVVTGSVTGPVTGSIKGNARDAVLNLKFKLEGDVNGGPLGTPVAKLTGSLKGRLSKAGVLTANETQSLKIQGAGAPDKFKFAVTQTLAGPFGWNLMLDVVNAGGDALAGTAHAVLGDGSDLGFVITGKFNAKKDQSTLTLKPDTDARGASIKLKSLTTLGSNVTDGQITYKLEGQSGKKDVTP